MKTNVVMIRKMQDFEVKQRTCDGMFNATELLKQWNKKLGMKKSLDHFFENQGTEEFIQVLEQEENLHTRNSVYVKSRASRGDNAGTWMNPILFIKFAMWLNPRFEYFVIRFVYDQLIAYRHDAGDNYRGLASAVNKFRNVDFIMIAKGLNYIVFNRHEAGIRQTATQEQLKELTDIQKKLAFAVDMGYIKSYDELVYELRRLYAIKNRIVYESINHK